MNEPSPPLPGVVGHVGLEVVLDVGLVTALQLPDVGRVLLAWVVQLAALTQSLEIHGQRRCLHVHGLVEGDGGLKVTWRGMDVRLAGWHVRSSGLGGKSGA